MDNAAAPKLDPASVTAELRRFLLENYLFTDDDSALDNTASFLETGLLDSTGMMELVMHIEDTFSVTIADDEMVPENLDSVDQASVFVLSKTQQ